MSNIMQDLHTVGINPFAVTLLAESVLKSPLAPMTVGKPQGFFMPVSRSDCEGWTGVRITVEAVPVDKPDTRKPCTCDGASRGPGRACVVKAGGRLGELWRCAEGAEPAPPQIATCLDDADLSHL